MLDVFCTRLRPDHLSVRVGDTSRRSEEIVKIWKCAFQCDYNIIIIIIILILLSSSSSSLSFLLLSSTLYFTWTLSVHCRMLSPPPPPLHQWPPLPSCSRWFPFLYDVILLLLLGRPQDLVPLLGGHSVRRLVHLLSFILAVCPAHFHVFVLECVL